MFYQLDTIIKVSFFGLFTKPSLSIIDPERLQEDIIAIYFWQISVLIFIHIGYFIYQNSTFATK